MVPEDHSVFTLVRAVEFTQATTLSGCLVPILKTAGRRLRLKWIALRVVLPLLAILIVFYQIEKIRGRQALDQSIREFAGDGEPLPDP